MVLKKGNKLGNFIKKVGQSVLPAIVADYNFLFPGGTSPDLNHKRT
jgi:hypothetical protein